MSSVTVEFVGICTHFSAKHWSRLPVPHRVVLVASAIGPLIHDVMVPEHVATLKLPGRADAIRLQGITLSLELTSPAATQSSLVIDRSFEQLVPQLRRLVAGIAPLSEPSAAVVLDRSPAEAACYFDIPFGKLYAHMDGNDAVYTRLVVESSGSEIVLTTTPFPGGILGEGLAARTTLNDGDVITVSNVDIDPHAKMAADFLLHYRTAARMPPIPQIPQNLDAVGANVPRRSSSSGEGTIGAGCSNSSYP